MSPRRVVAAGVLTALVGTATLLSVPGSPAGAGPGETVTALASAKADGTVINGAVAVAELAEGGRHVAFSSSSTDVVPGLPAGGAERVYVRDLLTDEVELVSRRADGSPSAFTARLGDISADGRYVVFTAYDSLVAADTGNDYDVYLYDRKTDTTELISVNSAEGQGNDDSGDEGGGDVEVSDDGRYVAFASDATNLTTDNNGKKDVFRRDRTNGTTALVSADAANQGNGVSLAPSMSANGRYIAFASLSTNWAGIDTNGAFDVWVRDMNALGPNKVSFGLDADPNAFSNDPEVSDDGRYVAFDSGATDLVASDTNSSVDVFLRDRTSSTTTRVSVTSAEGQLAQGGSDPAMTGDGSRIAFSSADAAVVGGDTNGKKDVFVREGGSTTLVTRTSAGAQVTQDAGGASISDSEVAWVSIGAFATTDTNGAQDVYVRRFPFIGPHPVFEGFVTRQLTGFTGSAPGLEVIKQATRMRAGASPEHYVVQLSQTPAFGAKRSQVVRLYWAYFKRRPDLTGLNYWIDQYSSGALSLNGISQKFAQSVEFKTKYANTTDAQFVTLVYQNVLERNPDASGLAFWVAKIAGGMQRGQVMTSFSETIEGRRVMDPYVSTVVIGIGMYGKIVPKELFDAIVAERKAGYPTEIAVDYILGYPDYAATLGL